MAIATGNRSAAVASGSGGPRCYSRAEGAGRHSGMRARVVGSEDIPRGSDGAYHELGARTPGALWQRQKKWGVVEIDPPKAKATDSVPEGWDDGAYQAAGVGPTGKTSAAWRRFHGRSGESNRADWAQGEAAEGRRAAEEHRSQEHRSWRVSSASRHQQEAAQRRDRGVRRRWEGHVPVPVPLQCAARESWRGADSEW